MASPDQSVQRPTPLAKSKAFDQNQSSRILALNSQPFVSNKKVQILQRRKWSEWSECTESCLRTRHRLNCDDLLVSQNFTTEIKIRSPERRKRQTTVHKSYNGKKQVQLVRFLRATDKLEKTRQLDSSSHYREQFNQEDDQDYADEGDEEDDTDSCAKVDPTKTFEERPCAGGQCKQHMESSQHNAIHRTSQLAPPALVKGRSPASLELKTSESGQSCNAIKHPIVLIALIHPIARRILHCGLDRWK